MVPSVLPTLTPSASPTVSTDARSASPSLSEATLREKKFATLELNKRKLAIAGPTVFVLLVASLVIVKLVGCMGATEESQFTSTEYDVEEGAETEA